MTGFAFDLGEWFSTNSSQVRQNLDRYFHGGHGDSFTGRWFEIFSAMGDPDKFEPSDVLAVEALSVTVPPESAAKLVVAEAERFNALLRQVPNGVDLWDVDRAVIERGNAAADLHAALIGLHDVGWVTAGKLTAAKRPRLIPILDKEVKGLLRPPHGGFWRSMFEQLVDEERRRTIIEVCDAAPEA